MTKSWVRTFILFVLISPTIALAKKGPITLKPDKQPPINNEYILPVPVSELKLNAYSNKNTLVKPYGVELDISSWRPSNFGRPSYLGKKSRFNSGDYPYFALQMYFPLTDFKGYDLLWKGGVGAISLSRSAIKSQSGGSYTANQDLTLLVVPLGLDLMGPRLMSPSLRPALGLSLLPTAAISAKSEIEDAVNEYGVPIETRCGVLIGPTSLRPLGIIEALNVGIFWQYVSGSVDTSRMEGSGLLGFMQMNL